MLELVACTQMAEWDRLVEAQPRATVFHRSDWLALVARFTGAQLHPFLIQQRGETLGVLPVFVFRRGPFRIAASPPAQAATPYLGPLIDETLLAETLDAFARAARALRAAYTELRFDQEVPLSILQQAQLQHENRATFVLDLSTGADALWRTHVTAACRRAVRKAQSAGVVIEEIRLEAIIERYYGLAVGVYAKSNRPPPLTRFDYGALAEVAGRSGCVKVLAAKLGDAVIAAGIFPYANGTVYYLDGVSDPAAQLARPNNLLHWEVIRWASAAGLQHYDMVGAGIAGVARFKQGFGPTQVPYTYAFRSLTPVARVARRAYALLAPAGRAMQHAYAQVFRRRRTPEESDGDERNRSEVS